MRIRWSRWTPRRASCAGITRWCTTIIFDYDVDAPPALIEVMRDGRTIPAVAETTKMGLLFILDRMTGKPVFGAEERPCRRATCPARCRGRRSRSR